MEIRLQNKQEAFLKSSADICIGGGAAGGGKSYALTVEPLRHVNVKGFNSVMFRRTYPEVMRPGGAWDEALGLYPLLGGVPKTQKAEFRFPKSRLTYGYLLNDQALMNWKSAQICLLMFDQLETFTERMFFYMLSRNRSQCGVGSYIRASANPEPNWLATFLDWWIAEDGYADMSRAGKTRAFVRDGDKIVWADTKQELKADYPDVEPKTVTFVPFTIYDNPILMEKDPGYLASLQALPLVDRERLLGDKVRGGNWKIKASAGKLFNRGWYSIVDFAPDGGTEIRYWDLAATEKKYNSSDPDWTASVKIRYVNRKFYVIDSTSDRTSPLDTDKLIIATSSQDRSFASRSKTTYGIRWEKEGGASGVRDSQYIAGLLAGYDCRGSSPKGDKIVRAKPFAAQSEAGNVYLVKGHWNEEWLNHMHSQPDLKHDDTMDASAGAFNELLSAPVVWDDVKGTVEGVTDKWTVGDAG